MKIPNLQFIFRNKHPEREPTQTPEIGKCYQYETPQIFGIADDYTPESKLFDYESLRQSPNFCVKRFDNATYRGEVVLKEVDGVKKELRHGFGVMAYTSGRLYEGELMRKVLQMIFYTLLSTNIIYAHLSKF